MSDAEGLNRSRRAMAQSLFRRHDSARRARLDAGWLEQIGLCSPLPPLPEDLWLRVFSFISTEALLGSCALVSHSWLHLIYQLTGRSLSVTGACVCGVCGNLRSLDQYGVESLLQHIAKRAGSLELLSLDCNLLSPWCLERFWYVLSGCSKLTALRLLGAKRCVAAILPPESWDLVPRGLIAVRFEGSHSFLGCLFLLDGLRELEISGSNLALLLFDYEKQGPELLRKLQSLTLINKLQYMDFAAPEYPEMLGGLTKLCLETRDRGANNDGCLKFIMSLTKLRTLQLKLDAGSSRNQMQVDKLSQLQVHSSLQEVHLLELAEEDSRNHFSAVRIAPLTKSACSFFGMRQLKVLSMAYMDHVEEALPGVDFSASGLQAVALVFKGYTEKMELSNLLNAPLLECLELEFVAGSEPKLSAKIIVPRHDKPFRLTLATRDAPQHQQLVWPTLQEGFGPQDPKQTLGSEFLLHQTLLKRTGKLHLRTYCNAAHTRAVKAKRSREGLAPRSCNYRLLKSKRRCQGCESDSGKDGARWY